MSKKQKKIQEFEDEIFQSFELPVSNPEGYDNEYSEINFREKVDSIESTSYATHNINQHPATFIPHIPRYLISNFESSEKNPVVLDPFSGSGSTGIEAKIQGYDYYGIEINPMSNLVSDVATYLIPPKILRELREDIDEIIKETEFKYREDYDVDFPGRTQKEHWFEEQSIEDITTIRMIVDTIDKSTYTSENGDKLSSRMEDKIDKFLIMCMCKTVEKLSNADPNGTKAHKSKKMREMIDSGQHPPDGREVFINELDSLVKSLNRFWIEVDASHQGQNAKSTVVMGDSREFELPGSRKADLVITSPPYINSINYYRECKLRLFWVLDFLSEYYDFEPREVKNEIIGSNSSVSKTQTELSEIKNYWDGTEKSFYKTSLPELSNTISNVKSSDVKSSDSRANLIGKFFMKDMAMTLESVYKNLNDGGIVFYVVGNSNICGETVQTHRHMRHIAENIDRIESCSLSNSESFEHWFTAFDEIQTRKHINGSINIEWVIALKKN